MTALVSRPLTVALLLASGPLRLKRHVLDTRGEEGCLLRIVRRSGTASDRLADSNGVHFLPGREELGRGTAHHLVREFAAVLVDRLDAEFPNNLYLCPAG